MSGILKSNQSLNKNQNEMNMLEGGIFWKLCLIAVPIALSSILQQLFNAADVAVVGRFASSEAMAAVGSSAPIINMVVTLFTGLAMGANVLIASLIGQRRPEKISAAISTSILLALTSGFLILVIGIALSRPILVLLSTPDSVIELAEIYLRIYFLGMPFMMIYNFCSAILRSIGDTRRPLFCLLISGCVNVALNLIFVLGLHRSADGVALATVLSNGLSAFMVFVILAREKGVLHFDPKHLTIERSCLQKILVVGVPVGLQGCLFSVSNVIIQAAINHFGASCIAGNSAALNFEYISFFVVSGFAQACMTFVSQNYSAGKFDRCRRTGRIAYVCGVCFTAIVSVTFALLRYPLLSIFSTDPEVIRFGAIRMIFITMLEPLTATYEIPGGCLKGIGRSISPTVITTIGCCCLRLIYITFGLSHFTDFSQVAVIYPISWTITGIIQGIAYIYITKKEYRPIK